MKRIQIVLACLAMAASAVTAAWSTPSSLVYIPSTDVQLQKTWHFGLDTYFTFDSQDMSNLVDTGLTYGLPGRIEVGVDHVGGFNDPIMGNAKWQLLQEKGNMPAVAVGGYNWGGKSNPLAGNLLYALVSKTFGKSGRLHLGFQHGQESRVGEDNDMFLVAWDKQLSQKWYGAIDYASGDSFFGALRPGIAYSFAQNTSVLFGYSFYNDSFFDDQVTIQVDANF